MKIILLFIALVSSIFGLSINESMLKVHSVLVPKILLMDYNIQDKVKNNTIRIAIAYTRSEYKYASSLKNKIDARYKNGIKTYKVVTELVKYKNINSVKANIYYLFPSNIKNIRNTIKQAHKNNALTFSYLKNDLKHGIMISLDIGKKIKTVLNLDAVKKHGMSLRPILIEISNIYRADISSSIYKLNFIKLNYSKYSIA